MRIFLLALFPLAMSIGENEAFGSDKLTEDTNTCCAYLGKGKPGFMVKMRDAEAKDEYQKCFQKMKSVIVERGCEQIIAITKSLGSTVSSAEEVEKLANLFNSETWDVDMIVHYSQSIGFGSKERELLLLKTIQIGDKSWWNSVFQYIAATHDDTVSFLINILAEHRDYKSVFDKYIEWATLRQAHCYSSNLEQIFPLLAGKTRPPNPQPNEDFKIFDSFCPYVVNGLLVNRNIQWITRSLSFAFTEEKIRTASTDTLALFLEAGATATEALRAAQDKPKALDWNLPTLFTDIVSEELRLSKGYAMASAIEMGMTRAVFNKVLEEARSKGRCFSDDFFNFIFIIKYSGLKFSFWEKEKEVAAFFVSAFLYQQSEKNRIRREDVLDIVHFVKVCTELGYSIGGMTEIIAATNGYEIKIKVLSQLILPVMNKSHENPVIDGLGKTYNALKSLVTWSYPHTKVLETMKLFVKLGLTDEATWKRINQVNEDKEVIKPYDFVKIHKTIAGQNQGVADNVIKYFFQNENMKQCDRDVVESIAKYNIAVTYKLKPNELEELYDIACSSTLSVRHCCITIDLAKVNGSSLGYLKNRLIP